MVDEPNGQFRCQPNSVMCSLMTTVAFLKGKLEDITIWVKKQGSLQTDNFVDENRGGFDQKTGLVVVNIIDHSSPKPAALPSCML